MDAELLDRAMRAYARTLNIATPIRLQFWDHRGLTMPQLRLMFLLLRKDGQCAGELASAMRVSPATVTGLTDRLVGQRLVDRRSDESDRRLVRVTLTNEGRRTLREIETASHIYLDRVFERMGERKVQKLVALMREFSQTAEAVQEESEFRP